MMCLACMEYMRGNLSDSEFKKNLREYMDQEHDPKALEKAEVGKEKKEEKPKNPRRTR